MDIGVKVRAVQVMQDYIHAHPDGTITLEDLSKAAGYSKWHCLRLFREVFRKTPHQYIKAMRLTRAALRINGGEDVSILNLAMQAGFDSHEGFIKAFSSYFGVNPSKYRSSPVLRRYMYFEPTSILQYYMLLNSEEYKAMSTTPRTVTVTVVEKPRRKLVLKRGITATDYFSWCEEIGCDAWELMETIAPTLDKVALVELPPHLIAEGTSKVACAVEVGLDFDGAVPEGFDVIELPAHLMMWFNGAPYEEESWFGEAHAELRRAIESYKPEVYGYEFALDSAPHFHYGTSAATGCREMIPVRRLADK